MPLQPRKPAAKLAVANREKIAADRAESVARHKSRRGLVADRYIAFINGDITVDDMDDEEIMRGQLRNAAGDFGGRPPKLIPREFAQAIQDRQRKLMSERIGGMVLQALETLTEVMQKPHPQPGDNAKVNAAKLILERNLGKVPETINLQAEIRTWEQKMKKSVKVVYKRKGNEDNAIEG
jgi:hypothetical protein